ncbi:hypothetical protein [Polaribacter atrinae]|uniref:hypothetical protein n=1 Tax=Polaribacter atrinae TaxID=1333662 RepID=UPI0030F9EDF3
MKKKLLNFLILFLITITAFGQSDLREKRHTFKYDITLYECNFNGTLLTTSNPQVMERGWIFRIRNIVKSEIMIPKVVGDKIVETFDMQTEYIIQISKFTSGKPEAIAQNALTYQKSNFENIYFKINADEYLAFAEELKRRGSFVVGASTTLIKIRPGNGKESEDEVIYSEFGNDFNIGVTAGWRVSDYKKNLSVSLVGGIGFSSIKVTPQTTRNFIDTESTQSSISYSAGAIFEIDKFQISAFIGIDTMSGEIGKNWIYRNRPWIGLGFGYEIFKPRGKDNKNPE